LTVHKLILFTNFLFIGITSYSQKQQFNCAGSILINQNVHDLGVVLYPENTYANKINSLEAVVFDSPESLMSSVLSASSLEWYNANKEENVSNSNQDFEYIKTVDPDHYFFELQYKVAFRANGSDYAIIKYLLHDVDKEPIGFAESMKLIEGRWYTTSEAGITTLLFFLGMIDTIYIDYIFRNSPSDNVELNKIIYNNLSGSNLDLNGVLTDLQEELNSGNLVLANILDPQRLFK
jgi:hypothetical protein